MNSIKNHFTQAQDILAQFISDDKNIIAVEKAGIIMAEAVCNGKKIIGYGNGGSMCDAMHFAEELSGKYRNARKALPALSNSDPTQLSCVANDYGFDLVLFRHIEAVGNAGDVLLAINTGGNSANVIEAVKNNSMKVVGLTGKTGGLAATLCDIEIRAPHSEYADRAQKKHIKVNKR
ncbi:MAG: SIS domain-containing protein [Bacteroidia bacterium]|nr:SIS domain-containing protein [Bacteroidia bacterium]MBP7259777.1 SIS domain-containing protein [Bacteroidia bacterium]MBP9178873.1 SIS domain-containing protein [Bacteroidia bacterium]MBP9723174.1 SIS domain-containing protein [Bacteroidia bacterium]